jgi:acetolactate synthase-1/2/3 large subunit
MTAPQPANPSPTPCRVADFIADFVARQGVGEVFLLPGGGAMYLVDAMGLHPQLRAVACLHEQAAAIAAEAYGRSHPSGLGVAVVTTGPGATNAITAVAGAWIESVPLLILSGQVKRADMLGQSPLRQKGVQEVDIVGMVGGITKYAKTVQRPEDIRLELEKALHLAHAGRGGPVWLDIPLDVQGAPIDPQTLCGYQPETAASADTAELEQAVSGWLQRLQRAERPLILAGHGVRLAGAAALFRQVVDRLGIPVVSTWNAMDLLPFDHPLNVGRPGVVALRAPNFAVQNCDLLLCLGSRLDNIITAYNPRGFARAAEKIVIDVDPHEIAKLEMTLAASAAADAGDFLRAVLARLDKAAPETAGFAPWRARCEDWRTRYTVNDGQPLPDTRPISHYRFVDALSEAAPPDTQISTGSSGLAIEVLYSVFRNKPGQRIFLTSGLGAMGYGLPAAIGACFAMGRRPMIAVESDGSLQLNIQELATLRAFNLPICLVIMNNGGYCSIRNTQRNYFQGRYVGTGPEAGLLLPDLARVAACYDLPFLRLDDPLNLETALKDAFAQPRPLLVEVMLTPDETLSPKVAALPQPDGSMLSMPLEDMSPLLPLAQLQQEMLIPLLPGSYLARPDTPASAA